MIILLVHPDGPVELVLEHFVDMGLCALNVGTVGVTFRVSLVTLTDGAVAIRRVDAQHVVTELAGRFIEGNLVRFSVDALHLVDRPILRVHVLERRKSLACEKTKIQCEHKLFSQRRRVALRGRWCPK